MEKQEDIERDHKPRSRPARDAATIASIIGAILLLSYLVSVGPAFAMYAHSARDGAINVYQIKIMQFIYRPIFVVMKYSAFSSKAVNSYINFCHQTMYGSSANMKFR